VWCRPLCPYIMVLTLIKRSHCSVIFKFWWLRNILCRDESELIPHITIVKFFFLTQWSLAQNKSLEWFWKFYPYPLSNKRPKGLWKKRKGGWLAAIVSSPTNIHRTCICFSVTKKIVCNRNLPQNVFSSKVQNIKKTE
jgi:hypothetical protein